MGRHPLSEEEREESRRMGRTHFEVRLREACTQVLQEIHEHPPNLICWLRGGVNPERAEKIREELENRIGN